MARTSTLAALAIAVLAFSGCATTESGTPSPTSPPSSADACSDFRNALERTSTQFAYLKVAVGSDIDETERLGTLTDYTGTLAADAPACAPEAAASLATLRDHTVALADAYVINADGAVAEGIYSILVDVRATGEQAWTQLGRDPASWKELPLHEDGSTID